MLATITQLKAMLGIVDAAQDTLLTSSLSQANGLLAAYIGADLSDVGDRVYDGMIPEGATYVNLPVWPLISISEFTVNGVAVAPADYTMSKRTASIFFDSLPGNAGRAGNVVAATYKAGFADVPVDLNTVCLNIAATIYNNGGQLAVQTSSNELKSLTMFDAMSMSFDTGSSSVNTPEGLIKTWGFMLTKYRLATPVMK